MTFALATICIVVLLAGMLMKRARDRRDFERHIITPEALHALLASNHDVFIIDVRHPLDLFGDSVIIPGAEWHGPGAACDDPSLISRQTELVVYCTCPSDKTGRAVLHRARAKGFLRVKLLQGGLDAWRAKGYPVQPYEKPLHLDSDQSSHLATAG